MRKLFLRAKSPRDPRLLMQIFRERLRQAIGQSFGEDALVVVEFLGKLLR